MRGDNMGDEISENLIAMEDAQAKQVTQGYDEESKPKTEDKTDEAPASDDE